MREDLRLDLLGPLRGWSGDRRLELGPLRQQAFLAVLALRPNQVVPADELVELVWNDAPPSSGTRIVPTYAYRLRQLLPEDVLVSSRDGYSLRIAPEALDLTRFERLVSAAHATDDLDEAAANLSEALALFKGEPLGGLPGHYVSVGQAAGRAQHGQWWGLPRVRLVLRASAAGPAAPVPSARCHDRPGRRHVRRCGAGRCGRG